jgi:hypothetical protein
MRLVFQSFQKLTKVVKMNKLKVEYIKSGKNFSKNVSSNELKKLLRDVVKIQICTRNESFEVKDSILDFIKNYKKYGLKNLSKKYETTQEIIKNKLLSLGLTTNLKN